MLNVLITVDTEIWCGGWNDLDERFPDAFSRYVYGPTKDGEFALPGKLEILEQYGIPAVFFVEPLFSARFGMQPLQELIDVLQDKNQEIQLHLHTEWVDEVGDQLLPGVVNKLTNMTDCSREQQSKLIKWGLERLAQTGVTGVNAFRGGSFGANAGTLRALADNGITFDTSYNLASSLGVADIAPGEILTQPRLVDGVYVYPVSVFIDPIKKGYRQAQINSITFAEMVRFLEHAYAQNWDSVVIVSHNFELLSADKSKVDRFVRHRFRHLCEYLDNNRGRFNTTGFRQLQPANVTPQPEMAHGELLPAARRYAEQIYRRFVY